MSWLGEEKETVDAASSTWVQRCAAYLIRMVNSSKVERTGVRRVGVSLD